MIIDINKLKLRDTQEFSRLVKQMQPKLMGVLCTMVDPGSAEELIQDTWVKVYQQLDTFREQSSISTWITTIALNEARGKLRKDKRVDFVEPADLSERFDDTGHWAKPLGAWHSDNPEDLFNKEALANCIDFTIGQLPQNQAIAVSLKDRDGMSLDEISNILDVSASNVRVLIHRGRNRLLNKVDYFEETGEC